MSFDMKYFTPLNTLYQTFHLVQGGGKQGWAKSSETNESFIANQRARERTEAEMDFLQAEVGECLSLA